MPNEVEDLIAAAFEEAEEPEAIEAPVEEPAPESEPDREADEIEEADGAQADTRTAEERARDEKGRFAPKPQEPKKSPAPPKGGEKAERAAAAGVQGKAAGVPTPSTPAAPPAAPVKAPQSWKPAVRELAAKLPPEFRPILDEVHRREAEITRTLQETAEARKTAETVHKTLAPYETIARANGMDAMQYAGSVLQTATALHMGTPQQKAAVVAQLIGMYGVDVEAINAAMTGAAPRAAPAPQQQPPDVSKMVQQEWDRRMQEAQQAKAAQAWQEFTAAEPEFLADVREDMALVLEKAGREGRNITYQQAYDAACKLNEGVASILAQRKAAETARTATATTARTRAAASSVKPTSAARPAPAQPKGIEAALAAAWDEAEERSR